MKIGQKIKNLRAEAKMTQAQFSRLLGVSQQSVRKWESDLGVPDLDNIVAISKALGISLDALILDSDSRSAAVDIPHTPKPQYQNMHDWEFYPSALDIEYQQSIEEGLDIEKYSDVFNAVSHLEKDEIKKKFGDVLYEIVSHAKRADDYKYIEPSDLEQIKNLRRGETTPLPYDESALRDKVHGAWMGRICGCLLGKITEGIRRNELVAFLKDTDNYPMHRYIYKSDFTEEMLEKHKFGYMNACFADEQNGMPVDDDTNYTVLAQEIIENNGRDFTPYDVSRAWLIYQGKGAYCTAERVAYCNFVKGFCPPESAIHKNPYREWIGAQIRADYFGYINPGNAELAAEMAWRDASISHVKNGIYGEMFVAAMLAVAATTSDIEQIIAGGLAQIPYTSRLHEGIRQVIDSFNAGMNEQNCFDMIHRKYDEYTQHGWCHTISNAMIVTAALLYGKGDYARSICMAVENGFDTDCNGATVGSVLGMANAIGSIPEYWTKPINDTLHTSIFRVNTVKISECVEKTLEHIAKQ